MSVLLAATCAAAVSGSLAVGDRSEVRLRNEQFVDGSGALSSRVVSDAETAPFAALRVYSRRAELTFGYAPRFTVRQWNASPPITEHLQRFALGVSWFDRRARFTVGEEAAVGSTSFATLSVGQSATPGSTPAPGAPSVERLPLLQTLRFASARTYFGVQVLASRRVRYAAYLDYTMNGGFDDDASRDALPFQRTARAELGVEVQLGRRDTFTSSLRTTRVGFDGTRTTPSTSATLFEQNAGLRHRFTRSTDGSVAIGLIETASKVGSEPTRGSVYPTAEGTLRQVLAPDGLEGHLEGSVFARLSPVVDRLTGRVDYQLQGALIGRLLPGNPRRGYLLRALVGVAESLPPDKTLAISVLLAEAAVGYRASSHVLLEIGGRAISQRVQGAEPPPLLWVGFVDATFTAEPFRW